MTKDATFECLNDRDSGRLFQNLEFEKCTFDNCYFSSTLDINKRSIARSMRFYKCTAVHSVVHCGVIENVHIEHLTTKPMLHVWGAVFSHVVFKGKIDRIMISPRLKTATAPKEAQLVFDKQNGEYYRHVDWALDISGAEFMECDIRGVPSNLIIRDEDTQMILTRERAQKVDWDKCGVNNSTYFSAVYDVMNHLNLADTIIVAPKRSIEFKSIASDLMKLKQQGIVY